MGISPFCHRVNTAEPETHASGIPNGFKPTRPQPIPIVLEVEISFALDAGIAHRWWG
jgi:hypothetical protein